MPGLELGIHIFLAGFNKDIDGRVKPGHDGGSAGAAHSRVTLYGAWYYSPPIRAPFSATERFISSTTNASATMTTASTQNTSK